MEIKAEDLQGETLIKTCQDYVPLVGASTVPFQSLNQTDASRGALFWPTEFSSML